MITYNRSSSPINVYRHKKPSVSELPRLLPFPQTPPHAARRKLSQIQPVRHKRLAELTPQQDGRLPQIARDANDYESSHQSVLISVQGCYLKEEYFSRKGAKAQSDTASQSFLAICAFAREILSELTRRGRWVSFSEVAKLSVVQRR